MTEYSKSVFSDPKLLREKLGLYLKTNDALKVEIYAQAAEKFFLSGGKMMLKSTPTWSWYAFFFYFLPLVYRKLYAKAVIYYLLSIFLPITMIILPMYFKYYVIKRFEKYLDLGDDSALVQFGGKNVIAIWIITVIIPIVLSLAISAILFFMIKSASSNDDARQEMAEYFFDEATKNFKTTNNAPNLGKILQDALKFYDKNGYMDELNMMTSEPLNKPTDVGAEGTVYDFYNNNKKLCMRLIISSRGGKWRGGLNQKDPDCSGFITDVLSSGHALDILMDENGFEPMSLRAKNHSTPENVLETLRLLVGDYDKYKAANDKSITKISQFSKARLTDELVDTEGSGEDTKSIYYNNRNCIYVYFSPYDGALTMGYQYDKDHRCDDLKNNVEIKNIVSKFATQN